MDVRLLGWCPRSLRRNIRLPCCYGLCGLEDLASALCVLHGFHVGIGHKLPVDD